MYLKNKKISIIGGGLVGSLLSIYMSQYGAEISVFDKRSDIRLNKSDAGRSINLALSNRGIKALKEVGIAQKIMSISMPMYKRIMHGRNGDLTEQPYGKKDQAIYSVSRKKLNAKLMDLAEEKSVNFLFQKQCVNIDVRNTTLEFVDNSFLESDLIVGSDGAGSVIRKALSNTFQDFEVVEEFIEHGYKELSIPANNDGLHKLSKDALHIWPRDSFMLIALPNLDGTFTCTLFFPIKGQLSFASLVNKLDVDAFFSKEFNDVQKMIPNLSDQYFKNPVSPLGLVRCNTWQKNNTFLIGDACHATVPFYGQGMNAGFEDCYLLHNYIVKNNGLNMENVHNFFNQRIIDTSAMQDLSISNFLEMRKKTTSKSFLLQKQIESWFSEKYPDKWNPLYSMVTFSDIPYSVALKRGKTQNDIMQKVMKKNKLVENFSHQELNDKDIEKQILKLL
ncbi:MAG: kynurenine 3-monooxygenase [Flavobacteriales bacterium]|nr:kynurenine 3-monooxygenase [Flavobacteriales bacterium]